MILWVINKYKNVKPVVIDGILYVMIAVCGAVELTLTNDNVYKYVNPYVVFYAQNFNAWILAAVTALKMFRSTSYGDHLAKQAEVTKNGSNSLPPVTPSPSPTNTQQTKGSNDDTSNKQVGL